MYVRLQWRGRDLLRHVVYFEDIDIFSCGKRIRKNTRQAWLGCQSSFDENKFKLLSVWSLTPVQGQNESAPWASGWVKLIQKSEDKMASNSAIPAAVRSFAGLSYIRKESVLKVNSRVLIPAAL